MSNLVRFAIVGRPNVGKSTLFNVLSGRRRAVVKDEPGVTRDFLYETVDIWGHPLELVDTGGVTDSEDVLSGLIKERVQNFLKQTQYALIVCDARDGVTPEDRELIRLVQHAGVHAVLVANKIDNVTEEGVASSEFYEFGYDVIAASVEQRRGVSDIMEWIHARTKPGSVEELTTDLKVTLIGKPNVGKSSLLNRLTKHERSLVSEVAGTTIDSIDSVVAMGQHRVTLIDTAGLRRQARRDEGIEKLSAVMSEKSIDRADLVLLMVDVMQGPTDQDARLMQQLLEKQKGVILVANKTDIAERELPAYRRKFKEQVQTRFHFFEDVWVCFISVKTGAGLDKLFSKIDEYLSKLTYRISTRELNEFFENVIRQAPAPLYGTKTVKFYYITQTKQRPPSFIAFANQPKGVDNSYRRFLIKRIKERWELWGVPIRIFVMKKGQKQR